MVKWKGLILGLLFVLMAHSYGAVYIFPPDYDDIKNSVQNGSTVVTITESSPFSNFRYTVYTPYETGGINVYYRCVTIPKISCSTGNIDIYANPVSIQLIADTGSGPAGVGVSSWQLIAEDLGSQYNICAMSYSDDGNVYFTEHDEGTHNATDNIYPKNNNSYIVISVRQICR